MLAGKAADAQFPVAPHANASKLRHMKTEHPAPRAAWHAMDASHAAKDLATDPQSGLDGGEARKRLDQYGPNRLPQPGKKSPLKRFLLQFHNTLIYVLIVAGAGKVFLGEFIDAGVIFGVVFINALLGFVQEGKAEAALDAIRDMLSPEALTLRGGDTRMLPSEELVPGDIVLLQSGDKVPADLRLFDVKSLRIEEAPLTGESVPVDKTGDPVGEKSALGDRLGMAYSGTLVVSGRGKGVVVATGPDTEIGGINRMLSGVKAMETPLLRQIETFGKALTVVILVVCAVVYACGRLFLDVGFTDMFKAVVGIAVAAIPEGLPAIVTITLAMGVRRMARRHAIIRRLPAVETLGSVSRICSDKTGTLTRNEMMVVELATANASYEVTGTGYAPEGEIRRDGKPAGNDPVLARMALAAALCNESDIHEEDGAWVLTGDPTGGSLLPFAAKAGISRREAVEKFPRTDSIPFESEHKFMATLHRNGGHHMLFVKGAPDVVMNFCDRQEVPGDRREPLDRAHWDGENARIAGMGRRVLALAWLPEAKPGDAPLEAEHLPRNLVLLGLVGIMDPPREEAVAAVKECHAGGIRVTMITGDHAITAASIAKMLGIGDGKTYATGAQIEEMDDDALEAKCRRIDVFARTSPQHKLRLVRAMQASHAVVSMTGDGVNDAPALKQADVGVAMGIKGTEVSKEAADMVLADDNFASITAAVREGRTVFNNIEKAILFILPTNGGQALTILSAILLGITLPITPPQILWVNMVTAVTLALAISFEPHEADVMRRPPRAADRPLLDLFGIWRIAFISLLLLVFAFGSFFWMLHHDASLELSRTVAVNALITGQIFYLLSCRFLFSPCFCLRALMGNKWVPLSITAVILLQILFTYAPFMQTLFGTQAVPPGVWMWLLLGGVTLFAIVESEKIVLRWIFPGAGRQKAVR
jgi:magnesium-transporting ATPase (P-type)